jgi:NAD(P)-dependent dehydrogenase (short-subunit alcohol dehydrogenase family)
VAAIRRSRPRATSRTRARLSGKIAVVTGATQGIGLAVARTLLAEGCEVVITGRKQTSLTQASKQLASKHVLPIVCDVRNPISINALVNTINVRFRRLDILVNNAGVAHESENIARLSLEAWNEVIETNLTGMFLVTQAALPLMRRGSVIVNNLSVAARRVFTGSAAYNASKHGALGFTDTLREELRSEGIRVIAVLPGATDTAIWDTAWPEAPRKKMMSAESVATALVNALLVPEDATVEELTIRPSVGTL